MSDLNYLNVKSTELGFAGNYHEKLDRVYSSSNSAVQKTANRNNINNAVSTKQEVKFSDAMKKECNKMMQQQAIDSNVSVNDQNGTNIANRESMNREVENAFVAYFMSKLFHKNISNPLAEAGEDKSPLFNEIMRERFEQLLRDNMNEMRGLR